MPLALLGVCISDYSTPPNNNKQQQTHTHAHHHPPTHRKYTHTPWQRPQRLHLQSLQLSRNTTGSDHFALLLPSCCPPAACPAPARADEYWAQQDGTPHLPKNNTPCLTIGSWFDFMCDAAFSGPLAALSLPFLDRPLMLPFLDRPLP